MKTCYYIIIKLKAVKLPSQTKNKATKEQILVAIVLAS
jgi:hypothetical protein